MKYLWILVRSKKSIYNINFRWKNIPKSRFYCIAFHLVNENYKENKIWWKSKSIKILQRLQSISFKSHLYIFLLINARNNSIFSLLTFSPYFSLPIYDTKFRFLLTGSRSVDWCRNVWILLCPFSWFWGCFSTYSALSGHSFDAKRVFCAISRE